MPRITGIPEHDATRDTARTGGIVSISRKASNRSDEGKVYSITGILLPPAKRKNFQSSSRYFQIRELGLSGDWELAHLWPPRFGDEAAAGIMAAPKEMNQTFQNHCVEPWIQDLMSAVRHGFIEITASAASWDNAFLMAKGNPDYSRTEIMKWVRYDVTDCPTGTLGPTGEPLLGTSIKMQLSPPAPGEMPRVVKLEGDTLLSWN